MRLSIFFLLCCLQVLIFNCKGGNEINRWTYKAVNYNLFGVPFDSIVYQVSTEEKFVNGVAYFQLSDGKLVNFSNGEVRYYIEYEGKLLRVFEKKSTSEYPLSIVTLDGDSTRYNLNMTLKGLQVEKGDTLLTFTSPRTISLDGSSHYEATETTVSTRRGIVEIKSFSEDGKLTSLTKLIDIQ